MKTFVGQLSLVLQSCLEENKLMGGVGWGELVRFPKSLDSCLQLPKHFFSQHSEGYLFIAVIYGLPFSLRYIILPATVPGSFT